MRTHTDAFDTRDCSALRRGLLQRSTALRTAKPQNSSSASLVISFCPLASTANTPAHVVAGGCVSARASDATIAQAHTLTLQLLVDGSFRREHAQRLRKIRQRVARRCTSDAAMTKPVGEHVLDDPVGAASTRVRVSAPRVQWRALVHSHTPTSHVDSLRTHLSSVGFPVLMSVTLTVPIFLASATR